MKSSHPSDVTIGTSNITTNTAVGPNKTTNEISSSSRNDVDDPNVKISNDLETVEEKISLCHAMLHDSKGEILNTNEALRGVIGFLEACAPRMVELVQAGTSGTNTMIIPEETLEKCFQVHDRLNQTLHDMNDPEKWQRHETSVVASKPAAAAASSNDLDLIDFLALDSSTSNLKKEAPTTNSGKTTGLNDDDDDDDPFNCFVNDRLKTNPDSK